MKDNFFGEKVDNTPKKRESELSRSLREKLDYNEIRRYLMAQINRNDLSENSKNGFRFYLRCMV